MITLVVKDDKIISDDKEVVEICNSFFINSVESLDLNDNNSLLTFTGDLIDPVMIALKRFENQPSIIGIKEKVNVENIFSFSKVGIGDVEVEVKSLKTNQADMFMDLHKTCHRHYWNTFNANLEQSTKLKYADIAPIFKKLESILAYII